nr:N-acetyltransferase [Hippea jasoniae]
MVSFYTCVQVLNLEKFLINLTRKDLFMEKFERCVIDPSSVIGENTQIGYFTVIGRDVKIGKNCQIDNNVVIHEGTIIGDNVRIDDNTVIGKQPMKSPISATTKKQQLPPAMIADNCLIGTSVVIYAGCKINKNVLVADLSTIRENVEIGEYTIVGRGVAIENFCTIGKRCKLETNVYITAYSEVEDYCFIAPGVLTSNDNYLGRSQKRFKEFGGVKIQKGGRIGVGAVILPNKTIAEDSVVAAGSLLTKDTQPKKIYAGLPAKYFRDVPEDELLENQFSIKR